MHVRNAIRSDVTLIADFVDTYLRRDFFMPRRHIADTINDPWHDAFIALKNGRILAYAVMSRRTRCLTLLLVHPHHRRQHIAQRILTFAKPLSVRVKLDMADGDPTAFYRRLGYTPTAQFNKKRNIQVFTAPVSLPPC